MNSDKNLSAWILGFCISMLSALVLGLLVVWLNIEQLDMKYSLKKMQREIDAGESLSTKLETERADLSGPYRLNREAEKMGMRPPEAGQQRKLTIEASSAADVNGGENADDNIDVSAPNGAADGLADGPTDVLIDATNPHVVRNATE